ncbi:MAG: ArsA family ATPase [Cyanobacteria bacterium P01_G01_bin.4]
MSLILTFLGKGGTGKTTVAIAAAKAAAERGKRTLLVSHEIGLSLSSLLEVNVSAQPQAIEPNLSALQLRGTASLESGWEMVKEFEQQYLDKPFFKQIFAQEIPVLPGMDDVTGLYWLKEYDASGDYDVIVYDGTGNMATLRAFGTPEVGSWYRRRASDAFFDSDLFRTLRPFADPLLQAVSGGSAPSADQLISQARSGAGTDLLDSGKAALDNPDRVRAYLVTSKDAVAVNTARFLWGSAQMVGLTIGGAFVTSQGSGGAGAHEFEPIPVHAVPALTNGDWSLLTDAVSPVLATPSVPPPVDIDVDKRMVRLFIPGFSKSQIELSQSGPELTITAGDQRRNLFLPQGLAGRQVTGAKFQEPYLTVSFG